MGSRLRMGIIGLGRRWPVYRQALRSLRSQVRPVGIYDPVLARAEEEAWQMGCETADGVVDLIERADIDAVLLAGDPWFGMWPIEPAVRAGKPVFCALSPLRDEAYLSALKQSLPESAHVQLAFWPALDQLGVRLTALLRHTLGQPRLIEATWITRHEGNPLERKEFLALLCISASLFGADPVSVEVKEAGSGQAFASVVLDFGAGRIEQLTVFAHRGATPRCSLDIQAEHGLARAELPCDLRWRDEQGRHTVRLSGGMQWQLERFLATLRLGERLPDPFTEVVRALNWRQATLQSQAQRRLVSLKQATQPSSSVPADAR